LPLALFGLLLAALGLTASSAHRAFVAGIVVALVVVDLWLGRTARDASGTDGPNVGRAVVAVPLFLIGMLLAGTSIFGPTPDWLGFVGLGFAIHGAGALISEARHSDLRRQGYVVLVVAFVLAAAGVVFQWRFTYVVAAILLTIALADLSIELRTEDYLRPFSARRPKPPELDGTSMPTKRVEWRRVPLGITMVAVAVALLRGLGASPTTVAVILIVAAALVILAAADNTSLGVVVLAVVALAWASTPRTADQPPSTEAIAGQPYFLVLGDSYISGEGAQRYFTGTNSTIVNSDHTNQCRRAPTAWPILLAEKASRPGGVPSRVVDVACSGALACHITTCTKDGQSVGPKELTEFDNVRQERKLGPPSFVVISIGGNDAGFGTIAETCIAPGNCTELMSTFLDYLRGDASHSSVEDRVVSAFQAVRKDVGDGVPIIAVPYPTPVSVDQPCNLLLTGDERRFVDGYVQMLDQVIQSAALRAGVYYADTVPGALVNNNKALCSPVGSGGHGLNFLVWNPKAGSLWDGLDPANWTHNNVHPNEIGHQVLLDAVVTWLGQHNQVLQGPPPQPDATHLATPIPQNVGLPLGAVGQCSLEHGTTSGPCDTDNNGWMYDQTVDVLRLAFLPTVLAAAGLWILLTVPYSWLRKKRFSVTQAAIDLKQTMTRGS
jgi:lysophospholipase L1-like esterase